MFLIVLQLVMGKLFFPNYLFLNCLATTSLTFHESEHGFQITATFINHVEHITRHSAISSQVIIRAHPGWTFIAEVTVSLLRAQSLGPMRVVYPISPHVYVSEVPSHHDHVRAERSAFGFTHQYLFECGNMVGLPSRYYKNIVSTYYSCSKQLKEKHTKRN